MEHWIDGVLAATVAEAEVANLGGFILGSNGGSPFAKLPVEVAEVAVLKCGEWAVADAREDQSGDEPPLLNGDWRHAR